MKKTRTSIQADELEVADIVWIDKTHGWCEITNIGFTMYNTVSIEFAVAIAYSGKYGLGFTFTKHYNLDKKFKIYE